jgi:ketosteroid isomerase-like protein
LPDEIEAFEGRVIEWMRAAARHDWELLDQILHPEFTLVSAMSKGEVIPRDLWLKSIEEVTMDPESPAVRNFSVRVLGDVALLTYLYRHSGTILGEDWTRDFIMSDVWVRTADRWQVIRRHSSYPAQEGTAYPYADEAMAAATSSSSER